MRTSLALALLLIGSVANAQQPYNYSLPMRVQWGYQAWALSNESEFVRKMPDHSDPINHLQALVNIRATKAIANYYESQTDGGGGGGAVVIDRRVPTGRERELQKITPEQWEELREHQKWWDSGKILQTRLRLK